MRLPELSALLNESSCEPYRYTPSPSPRLSTVLRTHPSPRPGVIRIEAGAVASGSRFSTPSHAHSARPREREGEGGDSVSPVRVRVLDGDALVVNEAVVEVLRQVCYEGVIGVLKPDRPSV